MSFGLEYSVFFSRGAREDGDRNNLETSAGAFGQSVVTGGNFEYLSLEHISKPENKLQYIINVDKKKRAYRTFFHVCDYYLI